MDSEEDDYSYEDNGSEDLVKTRSEILEGCAIYGPHTYEGSLVKGSVKVSGSFAQEMTLYLDSLWSLANSASPKRSFEEKLNYLDPPPPSILKDFEVKEEGTYLYSPKDEAYFQRFRLTVLDILKSNGEPDGFQALMTFGAETLFDRCFVCCRSLPSPSSPYHPDYRRVRTSPRFCMSHFCTFSLGLMGYSMEDLSLDYLKPFYKAMMRVEASSSLGSYLQETFKTHPQDNSLSLHLPVRLETADSLSLPLPIPPSTRPRAVYRIVDNLSPKALAWAPPLASSPDEASSHDESPALYFFHGTQDHSVLSILTYGLICLSGSALMAKGQVHGKGIYLSPDLSTSKNYGRAIFICQAWGAKEKTEKIYVADKGSQVILSHLLVL